MEIVGVGGIIVIIAAATALVSFLFHLHTHHRYPIWKISLSLFFIHVIATLISPFILSSIGFLNTSEHTKVEQIATLLPGLPIKVFQAEKHNAAVFGLGPTLTIGYSSTSFEQAPVSELLAVAYHELGHAKYAHCIWHALVLALLCYAILFGLKKMAVAHDLGKRGVKPWGITVIFVIIALLIFLLFHRITEHQADVFAKNMGQGEQLAAYLNRAIANEQRDEQDWKGIKGIWYLHPSIVKRIEFLTQ